MLLNRCNDTDFDYFGGLSGQNYAFSARWDFGSVASARAGAIRELKKHNFARSIRQNNQNQYHCIDWVASGTTFFPFSILLIQINNGQVLVFDMLA